MNGLLFLLLYFSIYFLRKPHNVQVIKTTNPKYIFESHDNSYIAVLKDAGH